MSRPRRVAVVGGGIAGLSAALALDRAAVRAGALLHGRLFESRRITGGVIRTERREGFLLDLGPDSMFRAKPAAAELARELGLGGQLIDAERQEIATLLWGRGGLHPLPDGLELVAPSKILPLVTTGLISPAGKLRMMLEPLVPARRDGTDESIAGFVRRRLGDEAARRIAGPLMAGIHAGDPERLSLRSTFPRLVEMEAKHGSLTFGMRRARAAMAAARKGRPAGARPGPPFVSLADGLQSLTDRIAAEIGSVEILTSTPVEQIEKGAAGYRLRLPGGGSWEADACVVAVPSWSAASLLRDLSPDLAQALDRVPYVSTATVFLGFPREAGVRIPPTTGFLVPREERRSFFGCTFVTNKFRGRAQEGAVLLRAFAGGAGDEERLRLSDEGLVAAVRDDLRAILGVSAEPSMVHVQRWERANPQYHVGHGALVGRVDALLAGLPGLFVTGSGLRGVGVPDGVELGRAAAEQVLRYIETAPVAAEAP